MRILYHHRTRGDGAEGIHINEMISAFEELDNTVRLVCPKNSRRPLGISLGLSGIDSNQTKTFIGKLKIVLLQFAEILYNAISIPRLFWACLRFQPDFIYERYSCYHIAGAIVSSVLRIPLVLEVNSTYSGRFNRRALSFPNIHRMFENFAFSASARICVVTQALRDCVLDRGVSANRILVTTNCINPKLLVNDTERRFEVRKQLSIPGDATVFGFVGSLRRWHGIEILLEIIPSILKRVENCFFLIVGSGELDTEVSEMVSANGIRSSVILTGGVEHSKVASFICAMDICLQPDSNEWCSPMKLLEYMVQGKACVAPRMPNIQEIIIEGETGLLFEKLNPSDLEKTLVYLAGETAVRNKLGVQSQRYVLENRTWKVNARSVLESLGPGCTY